MRACNAYWVFPAILCAPVRDVCQVVCDNIELFRSTQAAVGPEQLAAMAPAARERALQREMKAMGHLHVAMCTPDGHYKVRTAANCACVSSTAES